MPPPDPLEIKPFGNPVNATVTVPGSKSITNRALVLSALTGGGNLSGCLESEDTEVMIDCLNRLGFLVQPDWAHSQIRLSKPESSSRIPASGGDLFVANSGTTMRFLTALAALGKGTYRLDGIARMRERPLHDLLDALHQIGVRARSERGNGCPPVVIEANGLSGGRVAIKGDVSSQFLSGLLMAAPFAENDLTLEVVGTLVSIPYVEMTLAMMNQFGLKVENQQYRRFYIRGGQKGGLSHYAIEPDASAASYFLGAAAVTGGTITVAGLPDPSLQGDVRFAEVLEQMGCKMKRNSVGITIQGGPLKGIEVDMNNISDTVMTLGAVACFAEGPTTIKNVGHIRHKETDRLAALANELRRVGANVHEWEDGLTITPAPLHGAEIQTYNDHRMAMSLALVGLKVPGILINNPGCVGKTYPRFFQDLENLRKIW